MPRIRNQQSVIGTGDLRYLKLDCSNDPLTAALDIWGNLSVYDALHTSYIRMYHDGTVGNLVTNAGDISINPGGPNNINLMLGDALGVNVVSIQDSGNVERASIDSDGNFTTVAYYYAYNGVNYGAFYHDGADIMISGNAGDITLFTPSDVNVLLSDALGVSLFRVQDSGINTVLSIDSNGNLISIATVQAEHLYSTDDLQVDDTGTFEGASGTAVRANNDIVIKSGERLVFDGS